MVTSKVALGELPAPISVSQEQHVMPLPLTIISVIIYHSKRFSGDMLHVKVWKHLWGIKDNLMKFNTLSLLLGNIPFSIIYFGKCEKQTSFIMIHSAPWAGKRRI